MDRSFVQPCAADSHTYYEAKRIEDVALANIDLPPPEIRQDMDLIPKAVQAFTRCHEEELS